MKKLTLVLGLFALMGAGMANAEAPRHHPHHPVHHAHHPVHHHHKGHR